MNRNRPCKICGCLGRIRTNRTKSNRTKFFIHEDHGDCLRYINQRFQERYWRPTFENFTQPITCKACGRQCFRWNDENGRPFLFNELGPPWPRHDHDKQQDACSCWQWDAEGYVPCDIENGEPFFVGKGKTKKLSELILWARDLKSGSRYSLICKTDIKRLIKQRHQPFLFKWKDPQFLELNTFDYSKPRIYECALTQPQWPPPAVENRVFEPWGHIFA